jgi:hypothetical protein
MERVESASALLQIKDAANSRLSVSATEPTTFCFAGSMNVMTWRIISTVYQDQLHAWVIEDGDGIVGDGDVLDEFTVVWAQVASISPVPTS